MLTSGQCNAERRLAVGCSRRDVGTKREQLSDTDFATKMRRQMQGTETARIALIRIYAALQKRFGQTAPAKMDGLQQGGVVFVLMAERIGTTLE